MIAFFAHACSMWCALYSTAQNTLAHSISFFVFVRCELAHSVSFVLAPTSPQVSHWQIDRQEFPHFVIMIRLKSLQCVCLLYSSTALERYPNKPTNRERCYIRCLSRYAKAHVIETCRLPFCTIESRNRKRTIKIHSDKLAIVWAN